MSTKITLIAAAAVAAAVLVPTSAFASTFHEGWVLSPNGSVHRGWVTTSKAVPAAYAYARADRPSAANNPTMYMIKNRIPVPAHQLPGYGSKP
jgi:hypothetical protein